MKALFWPCFELAVGVMRVCWECSCKPTTSTPIRACRCSHAGRPAHAALALTPCPAPSPSPLHSEYLLKTWLLGAKQVWEGER